MKFCTQCGSQLNDNAAFCTNCGTAVGGSTQSYYTHPHPQPQAAPVAPVARLKTNRSLIKYILLSAITFGIYGLVVMSTLSTDINIIAGRYDGKKTMHFLLVTLIFSWLTCGIVPLVWYHRLSNRIGTELSRRGITYPFSSGTFWGWGILGSLIIVGPFIYFHRLFKSMNMLAGSYNARG